MRFILFLQYVKLDSRAFKNKNRVSVHRNHNYVTAFHNSLSSNSLKTLRSSSHRKSSATKTISFHSSLPVLLACNSKCVSLSSFNLSTQNDNLSTPSSSIKGREEDEEGCSKVITSHILKNHPPLLNAQFVSEDMINPLVCVSSKSLLTINLETSQTSHVLFIS